MSSRDRYGIRGDTVIDSRSVFKYIVIQRPRYPTVDAQDRLEILQSPETCPTSGRNIPHRSRATVTLGYRIHQSIPQIFIKRRRRVSGCAVVYDYSVNSTAPELAIKLDQISTCGIEMKRNVSERHRNLAASETRGTLQGKKDEDCEA